MFKIQTLNNISDIIHNHLTADKYMIAAEEPVPDGIIVRSAKMHGMELPESMAQMAATAMIQQLTTDGTLSADHLEEFFNHYLGKED